MDTYYGVGYYAIQHAKFPVKTALKVFEGVKRPALSFVWGTFGNKTDGVHQWFQMVKDRPHLLEIHLMNQVCVRNGNCGDGELLKGTNVAEFNRLLENGDKTLMQKIETRVKKIAAFVSGEKNANSKIVLSLGLEDNFSAKAADKLSALVQKFWPYEIARNPAGMPGVDGGLHGAAVKEYHDPHAPIKPNEQSIVNFDGTDIDFSHRNPTIDESISGNNVKKILKESKGKRLAVFLWSALHQGLTKTSAKAPPPRARTPEVSEKDVQEMRQWLLAMK